MNVKIDTKEKFSVITPADEIFTANMTEELSNLLLGYINKNIPHLVLNLEAVKEIDVACCETIATIQQQFYEQNCSFVICEMAAAVEDVFEQAELLELLNATPTETEAWDIVQMEEIERELLGDFD